MVDKDNSTLMIQFVSWTIHGDHVEYQIKLFNDHTSAEFTQRYSALRDFHEALKNDAKDPNFPKFPPKKFFGNTDKQFLNQRMVGLQHYFSCILTSKEFSNLKPVKNWITDILKKYGKSKDKKETSVGKIIDKVSVPFASPKRQDPKVIQEDHQSGSQQKNFNQELVGKRKEIAEKYSKNFIELGDNVPHFDEELEKREKSYKVLLKNTNIFEIKNSELFKIMAGDDSNFKSLGLKETKISQYEKAMILKLDKLSQEFKSDVPEFYFIQDLIIEIPVSTK